MIITVGGEKSCENASFISEDNLLQFWSDELGMKDSDFRLGS